jgi:transposase, IS5 family
MLRDRATPVDLFALVPALALRFEPELAELDRLLADDGLFRQVKADMSRRRPHTTETGRPSTPVEVVLRLLVVQHLYGWSYEQTEHFVGDSLVLRQFCRLGVEPVPHHTTVPRWAGVLRPGTLHGLLERVTELARSLKVTRGRKLRTDSTVVATAIHYPTDSTLLADGVRVLSRLVRQARGWLIGHASGLRRDRTRSAKRLARRIREGTAVHASRQAQAERPGLYRRLLGVARASLQQAERVQHHLAGRSEVAAARVRGKLAHFQPLVERVIAQAERRVLAGERVPAADKLVSLFEPHTAIIRKGQAHLPAEFGRKVLLDEVDGGLVSRYVLLAGNSPDAPELAASLAHHQACSGRAPSLLAADRSFFTLDNERLVHDAGIPHAALPRPGPLGPARRRLEHRPAFRRADRWRAGVEGRISLLKRRFGPARCRYHGERGLERWVGLGLLAHNLRQLSHALAARRAAA